MQLNTNTVHEIMQLMERRAKADAQKEETGQSFWDDICVRYYPKSGRYSWFLGDRGHVNKIEVYEWFMDETSTEEDNKNVIRINDHR